MKKITTFLSVLLIVVFVLAACGPKTAAPAPAADVFTCPDDADLDVTYIITPLKGGEQITYRAQNGTIGTLATGSMTSLIIGADFLNCEVTVVTSEGYLDLVNVTWAQAPNP